MLDAGARARLDEWARSEKWADLAQALADLDEMKAAILAVSFSAYPAHGTGWVTHATGSVGELQELQERLR